MEQEDKENLITMRKRTLILNNFITFVNNIMKVWHIRLNCQLAEPFS